MKKQLTNDEFILKSKLKFGNLFNYSMTNYINKRTKVCIICPIHGPFEVLPHNHLKSDGCPICVKNKKDVNTFIDESNLIHNNKYDYSKVEYNGNKIKICIICPKHGEFWQTPSGHLRGNGCPKCKSENISKKLQMTTLEFIKRSKIIHGNSFNYDKTNLETRINGKVIVTCNKCKQDIYVRIGLHLFGNKCPYCYGTHLKTNDEFIEDAKKIHGDKYDYSKVDYKGNKIKVCIICPKHGEFWQTPNCHLRQRGCPKCKNSYLENEIHNILTKYNILFEYQKRFDWLGRQSLDFFLPQYNIAIECQGKQHYESVKKFGGVKQLKKQKELDYNKIQLCNEHNIKMIYYSNVKYNDEIITSKNKIIKEILNYNVT